MLSPKRRNDAGRGNLQEKSRHVLVYMSVFFFLVSAVIIFSSFKPGANSIPGTIPPDSKDTIYVYDTVYYYDTTFVYDTVFLSEKITDALSVNVKRLGGKGIFSKNNIDFLKANNNIFPSGKYLFSFDLFFSPMYSLHSFQSDLIYKDVSELNKNSVNVDISSSFGMGINFHKPFMTYSSGLNYTKYRENFNFLATDYLIDTINGYNYFTTTEMFIDSTAFINIDTLLATGDTIYYYFKDTSYITNLDSNLVLKVDSSEYQINEKTPNSYSYLEIPLILGFNIYRTNFSISPQFGIITSFFIDSDGKIVSLANLSQSNGLEDEARFSFVNLSFYTGLRFNYFLNRKLDFFTSAYYRKNLNSVYNDYPIISRFNTFGFKIGLRYKLTF